MDINLFLVAGALLSAIAAVLHIGIVIGGPSWYRFFGAGEQLAVAAEKKKMWPHIITLGIAAVLFGWAAYALSGAGVIEPLPFARVALVVIAAIYMLRGAALIPLLLFARNKATPFLIWSSVICLVYGAVHVSGVIQVWPRL